MVQRIYCLEQVPLAIVDKGGRVAVAIGPGEDLAGRIVGQAGASPIRMDGLEKIPLAVVRIRCHPSELICHGEQVIVLVISHFLGIAQWVGNLRQVSISIVLVLP